MGAAATAIAAVLAALQAAQNVRQRLRRTAAAGLCRNCSVCLQLLR